MSAKPSVRRQTLLVPAEAPDLPAQLETLLHLVWQCEEEWRLDDRIDLAVRREEAAEAAEAAARTARRVWRTGAS